MDEGDNSVVPTFLFLRNVLTKAKERNPFLKKCVLMGDGGPKHFRNTLSFFLFPHLQRLVSKIELEWYFFKEYHGKFVYDPEGGIVKNLLYSCTMRHLPFSDATSAAALVCSDFGPGISWRNPAVKDYMGMFTVVERVMFVIGQNV